MNTLGTVVITFILNSLSKRSYYISACNIPKNPLNQSQVPSKIQVQMLKTHHLILISIELQAPHNHLCPQDKSQQKPLALHFEPSIGFSQGLSTVVIVSPTTSLASLFQK